MLCVVINGPTAEDAHKQLRRALAHADLVELRLDHFHELDLAAITRLCEAYPLPLVFTLRDRSQGGRYVGSEESRRNDIRRLAALKPDFIDLEMHLPIEFVKEIIAQHPEVKIIVSYHDLATTPDAFEKLYLQMQIHPAYFYKIAVNAEKSTDMLKLLNFVLQADKRVIAISMGLCGISSRILAPALGSPITYACLDEDLQTAPGQLTAQTLAELYRIHALNPSTSFYGLIGDPIETSISDMTHNALMGRLELNAVYVKIAVKVAELPEFLALVKTLPFRGFSVTMPLKEAVMPYLEHLDPEAQEIGAVNTLLIENGKITGYNTDGHGALNAIAAEMPVRGRRLVILGAGGAAKAIAYEACRRGALVTILNRDVAKARALAAKWGCKAAGLDQFSRCYAEGYDLLINTIPLPMPIDPSYFLPGAIIMDIKTKPLMNPFLRHAREKGCGIIPGYRMFVEQALGQFALWFKNDIAVAQARRVLNERALLALQSAFVE